MLERPDQRRWRADKIASLGTITAAALIFGQLVSSNFRVDLTLIAMVMVIVAFIYSYWLMKPL